MSQFDEKVQLYCNENKKLGLGLDDEFIRKVTKGLGPSIYKKDAASVSCSDSSEMDRVKKNFLIKKLGLSDGPELESALEAVCQKMGSSNRNKYRALFYALLAKHFGKESIYS